LVFWRGTKHALNKAHVVPMESLLLPSGGKCIFGKTGSGGSTLTVAALGLLAFGTSEISKDFHGTSSIRRTNAQISHSLLLKFVLLGTSQL